MDLISQLPECMVNRILCYCPPAELVRMSVLSKTWFRLTASFPILDFNIHNFTHRLSFFKYVAYTTLRFCHQDVTAHTVRLITNTNTREPVELYIVNRCLELLLQKGVVELVIDITNSSESPSASAKYCLPNILLSVSALTSLTIRGCDLPSSFMLDVVNFKSLIQLRLQNVLIDDEMITYLAIRCPRLQLFDIRTCPGFKRFCVYGHENLQDVWIVYNTPVERIDIGAPNLAYLSIMDDDGSGPPQMNFASCKKLKNVSYTAHPLSNSTDFLSNFPFVENLILVTPYKCNNLKLSSHSLKTLVLKSNCHLEEIEFNTPNLVSFSYTCSFTGLISMKLDKRWPLLRDSNHLKACMHCYPVNHIDTLWFQKLRQFLHKRNGFKVFNLYIHAIYSQIFTELEKLKAIELPPYELELVELQLETDEESLAHIAFVDAVLWCCRPRSLTLRSSSPLTALDEQSDVVKFTYERLLAQEDQGRPNIQIVSPSFSSLLMALPHEGKAISFIKEEVLQRFAGSEIV